MKILAGEIVFAAREASHTISARLIRSIEDYSLGRPQCKLLFTRSAIYSSVEEAAVYFGHLRHLASLLDALV